ncbi:MAG TPA: GNAT family N-acetyltransferase [Candidatus Cryosericum sp.]|nr:GNAT family N-acetyltransferase [Candidatus Cryosericum sp.]
MSEYTLKDGRTLILRDPTLDDAEEMVDYLKVVGSETDFLLCDENGIDGLTLEGERDWITATLDAPNTRMFVGTVNGEIVLVCDVRAAARKRIAHVGGVAISIKRDYWRFGIGSIAMREMIDFAKSTGVLSTLSLEVREGNERAISLYKRFGFTEIGRHKARINVRGTYYDEILMDLDLTQA